MYIELIGFLGDSAMNLREEIYRKLRLAARPTQYKTVYVILNPGDAKDSSGRQRSIIRVSSVDGQEIVSVLSLLRSIEAVYRSDPSIRFMTVVLTNEKDI